jgi:hypothetical protein
LLGLLGGEHRFAEDDEKVLTGAILGKAQEAKPVISTAMANPETIFSERDMFMRFLRSPRRSRKGKATKRSAAARDRLNERSGPNIQGQM